MPPQGMNNTTYALLDRWRLFRPGDMGDSGPPCTDQVVRDGNGTRIVVYNMDHISRISRWPVDINARDFSRCTNRRDIALVVANDQQAVDVALAKHDRQLSETVDVAAGVSDNS